MTPNVYRASDGWTSADTHILECLYVMLAHPESDVRATAMARTSLSGWIDEAPTKEPAR